MHIVRRTVPRMAAHILLFHSALGIRPAITRFGDLLRADGHKVAIPDLFDGEVFDTVEDGVRKRDALGIPTLAARAHAAAATVPSDCVYIGFSMGAASAEMLAATRPGARAVVLIHGVLPPSVVGATVWPPVAAQLHLGEADPWIDWSAAEAFVGACSAAGGRCDVHRYATDRHLFTDAGSAEHQPVLSQQVFDRVREFLRDVG